MNLFENNQQNKTEDKKKPKSLKKEKTTRKITIKDNSNNKELALQELKSIESFSKIKDNLLQEFNKDILHHAIMLSGNYGIGKATFAYWVVSEMIISECKKYNNSEELVKMHINLLKENIHPDVYFLKIIENNNEIKIEQIRKLLNKISLKSTYGSKFIIIDDINSINKNGLNALLKTLEEPTKNTFFFIIDHKTTNLLDTIYSRCRRIEMKLSKQQCIDILKQLHENWNEEDIELYTNISNSINFSNILAEIDIKKIINQIDEKNMEISTSLNFINKQIDTKYKNMPRILKINLLEQIIIYLMTKKIYSNSELSENIVKQNSNLLHNFLDIKKYELPIKFI